MYEKLAEVYDAMYHFKDYGKESPYVIDLIRTRRPQAHTLLEVACGTGLYLEQLRPHFEVEGLDISPQMLRLAAARLPQVALHEADMVEFDLGKVYDVVCCLFRSIAFVKTRQNLISAVQSMARHVAPGGLLMIEPYFTPKTYWVDKVTLNEYKSEDLKVAWMYVSEKVGLVGRQDMHFIVGTPKGVSHFTELHELGLFAAEDFADAFAAAGLVATYDPTGPSGVGLYWATRPFSV
jgi:ubiquinone/menaquinone biosynthesis C-methylase UbiE